MGNNFSEAMKMSLEASLNRIADKMGIDEHVDLFLENLGPDHMNAYVTTAGDGRQGVFISTAMVDNFSLESLEGVVAHELSHAKHKDVTRFIILGFVFLAASVIGSLFVAAFLNKFFETSPLVLFAPCLVIAQGISNGILRLVGRRAELRADADAARAVGVEQFANVLEELCGAEASIVPLGGGVGRLFASHPPLSARLKNIAAVAAEEEQKEANRAELKAKRAYIAERRNHL